jgi:photosystem II stability/assembly factor-like uncharacterized protein
MNRCARVFAALLCGLTMSPMMAQQNDSSLYAGMRWRQIGPFRAGRVSAVAGIPGDAATYYMGSPGGGVWKTVDGGVVWTPIMDSVPVASIGAIVVSPSQPDVVYVGTGDVSLVGAAVNVGKGVWKSTDAGRTWKHVGLDETEHIGTMWVDPKDPNVVVVAALGKTFSKNPERGIFKTVDGGKTWKKTLYKDEETGAIDVAFDATNTKVGYCALWHHLVTPGHTQDLINGASGGAIYKTTDGGDSWTPVGGEGLPKEMSRIGVATALGGSRVFAIVTGARGDGGFFRSDDGGATWVKSTTDSRVTGNGYFSRVFLDPKNPDIMYVAQTSLYRSVDGGKTFISYKGAPGGDDNHALWIDPTNSARMIMASDQGATISQDTGASWSSWYNQPTGQVYHMSTDNRWPYWVYGTQQDSGSVATLSRGDYGAITFLDWDPVAAYEFGYIVPSPLNPNMVYAGGPGRGTVLLDRVNRQVQTISPTLSRTSGEYRFAQNPPLAFSPQDGHVFYEGTQYLLETSDAGKNWKKISPDLTERPKSEEANAQDKVDAATAAARPMRTREATETLAPVNRNAINCFSPSPVAKGEIWAGTTNGLVQLTTDGGATWKIAGPAGLSEFATVSMLEASHFEAGTAYASIDRHEENDFKPHIYRTRDMGKTWTEVDAGIGPEDFVRVVREDPKQKGLLYAGTENTSYVSFDDGGHWSALGLNMPTASVRDLQINGDDLVAATYGRAFWVLDDVASLRAIAAEGTAKALKETALFKPARALRVQLDLNGDTPLPPEMPAGQNPPNGALIDFYLKTAPADDIQLAVYDMKGGLVREFTTKPGENVVEPPPNVPDYWLGHPDPLTKKAGMNRFLWDLRYTPPAAMRHNYPISAMYGATPAEPQGALVVPGTYEVRLTVAGKTYKQPIEVALDPRVATPQAELQAQFELEKKTTDLVTLTYDLYHKAVVLRETVTGDEKKLSADPEAVKALKDFDMKVSRVAGAEARGFGGGGAAAGGRAKPTFTALNGQFGSLATVVDSADSAPTPAMQSAYGEYCRDLTAAAASWNELLTSDLPALNGMLAKDQLSALPATAITLPVSCPAGGPVLASGK